MIAERTRKSIIHSQVVRFIGVYSFEKDFRCYTKETLS